MTGFDICDPRALIWTELRKQHIYTEQKEEYQACDLHGALIGLMDKIIYKGRQDVDYDHASYAEYQQALRTDPSVEIQKIAAVIPPFGTVIEYFHEQ